MSVSSVSFWAYQEYQGVSLRIIALKSEFLNSFVSLTQKRIIRIIFMRVCLSYYLAIFKKIKIIIRPELQKRKKGLTKALLCPNEPTGDKRFSLDDVEGLQAGK